eukprot:SAG31_NODE_820_length_11808_cov_16.331540_14_plen_196_part_00
MFCLKTNIDNSRKQGPGLAASMRLACLLRRSVAVSASSTASFRGGGRRMASSNDVTAIQLLRWLLAPDLVSRAELVPHLASLDRNTTLRLAGLDPSGMQTLLLLSYLQRSFCIDERCVLEIGMTKKLAEGRWMFSDCQNLNEEGSLWKFIKNSPLPTPLHIAARYGMPEIVIIFCYIVAPGWNFLLVVMQTMMQH